MLPAPVEQIEPVLSNHSGHRLRVWLVHLDVCVVAEPGLVHDRVGFRRQAARYPVSSTAPEGSLARTCRTAPRLPGRNWTSGPPRRRNAHRPTQEPRPAGPTRIASFKSESSCAPNLFDSVVGILAPSLPIRAQKNPLRTWRGPENFSSVLSALGAHRRAWPSRRPSGLPWTTTQAHNREHHGGCYQRSAALSSRIVKRDCQEDSPGGPVVC